MHELDCLRLRWGRLARAVAGEKRARQRVGRVGMGAEAALHARAHDRAEARRGATRAGAARRPRAAPRPTAAHRGRRESAACRGASSRIRRCAAGSSRSRKVRSVDRRPAGERQQRAPDAHHVFGGSAHHRRAGDALRRIRELRGVDVDGDDLVVRREAHRRAAGRRDAEHPSAGFERRALDRGVLVHAAEEHARRATAGIEPPRFPCGTGRHAVHRGEAGVDPAQARGMRSS